LGPACVITFSVETISFMNVTGGPAAVSFRIEKSTPTMNTNDTLPEPAHRRGAGFSVSLWLTGFLVLYVLSTGPVAKLNSNGAIPGIVVQAIYLPLNWCSAHCEPFHLALRWYVSEVWHG
jgi:hypothetical protein